jgi:hypothetical protein
MAVDPMTQTQKRIVLALTIVIALTRLFAIAHSMFDWDEGLFSLGVSEYNVIQYRPHPPGYPLFIAAAKAFHLFGMPEFRAVQAVVVLGAICLFPVLFFLAREIGFDFATSVCGAVIFSFLPNVWVYGGTGFSDVPGAAIGLAACALLLRGRHDTRAYLLGAIVLGLAAGFRPMNLVLGFVPAILATIARVRKSAGAVVLAILLGGAIAAGSYAGAVLASGPYKDYANVVRIQSKYVHDVDSYHNPQRAPLREMAKIFFIRPVDQRQRMTGLALLAVISLVAAIVKKRLPPLLTFAIFTPLAILSWLNLDFATAARYAIPYMAAHALLAADALGLFAQRRPFVQGLLCAVVAAVFAVWTWPALRLQRTTDSPPAAALEWIRHNVPAGDKVYVHGGIGPVAQAILGERPNTLYYDEPSNISLMAGEAWILDLHEVENGQSFLWKHSNPLWKIVRRRNFESSVGHVSSQVHFGEGWHGDEGPFRWMSGDSTLQLAVLRGSGKLQMRVYVPLNALPTPPTIEVRMNGVTVERFTGSPADIEKSWIVPSRPDAPNELRILTSATVNPAKLGQSDDARDLGLRLDSLSWTPVQ